MVFNRSTAPTLGAAPIDRIAVEANKNFEINYGTLPFNCSSGVAVGLSSTAETFTPATADALFTVAFV